MSYFNKRLIEFPISHDGSDESQALITQAVKDATADTGAHVWIEESERTGHLQLVGESMADIETVFQKVSEKTGSHLVVEDPSPAYMETATIVAEVSKTGTPQRKEGTITIIASPLSARLAEDIEKCVYNPTQESSSLADKLVNKYEWDEASANNVLAFGGANGGSNVIVNLTKAPLPATAIPDILRAFNWVMTHGPLVRGVMRATRFDITATTLVSPEISGKHGIFIATRRALCGAFVRAGPSLYQPVYEIEMTINVGLDGSVLKLGGLDTLTSVSCEARKDRSDLLTMKGQLPVMEWPDFLSALPRRCKQASDPQVSSVHWNLVPGALDIEESPLYKVVTTLRAARGLPDVCWLDEHFTR